MPDYAHFQAGAALMQAAMAGETTRMPVYAQMHEFVAAQLRIPGEVFYTRPDVLVPAMLEVQTQYGLDVVNLTYDIYNIEAEALGQRVVYTDANMADIDRGVQLVRERSDLACIKTPDFDAAGRFAKVIEILTLFKRLTGLEPSPGFCAPFSLAANLRGIEPLLMDIYADPDFARELMTRVTEEVLAPWILYQQKHFPNATGISGADATASPPIVNVGMLKQWVVPYILRLRELCGSGVYVANWIGESRLKNPEEMLKLKLAVGPGSLQGQDPDVAALGPNMYKRLAEKNGVPLILGVGAAFLATSTPSEIAERVRRYVETGRKGGRFALYLCNIGATTPPENLRAAVETAHAC